MARYKGEGQLPNSLPTIYIITRILQYTMHKCVGQIPRPTLNQFTMIGNLPLQQFHAPFVRRTVLTRATDTLCQILHPNRKPEPLLYNLRPLTKPLFPCPSYQGNLRMSNAHILLVRSSSCVLSEDQVRSLCVQ